LRSSIALVSPGIERQARSAAKRREKHVHTELNPATGVHFDVMGPTVEFLT
jgi:hypothetical protein